MNVYIYVYYVYKYIFFLFIGSTPQYKYDFIEKCACKKEGNWEALVVYVLGASGANFTLRESGLKQTLQLQNYVYGLRDVQAT